MKREIFSQLLPFLFRVLLLSYFSAVALEGFFPGFVTFSLNLDLFLRAVIISWLLSVMAQRYFRSS